MSESPRVRLRELGVAIGDLPPGPGNAITDVAGVRVGHTTIIEGEGALRPGFGPIRTGVTVVLPHGEDLYRQKVCAAVHRINGFGKPCGFEEVRELGVLESPIALTNTLNVWRVADALVEDALQQNPAIGIHTSTFNPVVGECNDGYLNDIQGRHVQAEHVAAALAAARRSGDFAPVAEGCVGGGTGTRCYGWKGGIGTASRVAGSNGQWTLGVLVQSNFGSPEALTVAGMPLGRQLKAHNLPAQGGNLDPDRSTDKGSIMMVLATDAPLDSRQLQRICGRAVAGLARTGSHLGHGSGDFAIAFSTARRIAHWPEGALRSEPHLVDEAALNTLFTAVIEAVEEAVLNSLCMATTLTGRDGHVCFALPLDRIRAGLRR